MPTKLLKEGFYIPPGKLPLTGWEKISSSVRWYFRFIPIWYGISVPDVASSQQLSGHG
jgi:hypothetical protein